MLEIDHPGIDHPPVPAQPGPVQPTSGAWRYEDCRIVSDAPVGLDATLMPIADVTCAFKSLDEMHANGRLMAASPILLLALKQMLWEWPDCGCCPEAPDSRATICGSCLARAALAIAEGNS